MNAFKSVIKWIAAIVVICIAAYFLASVNGLSVSHTMGKVGNLKITEAEYKYYLEIAKESMLADNGIADEAAAKDFWNSEIDGKKASDIAKEDAKAEMLRVLAACIKAEEAGITLTEEEKSSANSVLHPDSADLKEQVSAIKKATGADGTELAAIMERQLLANAYANYLAEQENTPIVVDDADVAKGIAEKYARVKHVLIQNTPATDGATVTTADGTQVPATEPTEEELAAYMESAKIRAEEVLKKATSGENFENLVAEYGEDPGMESTPDGYVIDETGIMADGSGQMVTEFTKGTFAVKAGEVNPELVESSYGWHIIKRYAIDPDSEVYATVRTSVESMVKAEKYEVYMDDIVAGMDVTLNEKVYNKIQVK